MTEAKRQAIATCLSVGCHKCGKRLMRSVIGIDGSVVGIEPRHIVGAQFIQSGEGSCVGVCGACRTGSDPMALIEKYGVK